MVDPMMAKLKPCSIEGFPLEVKIAGERLWEGDYLKEVDGVMLNCPIHECTHLAHSKAMAGHEVYCEPRLTDA